MNAKEDLKIKNYLAQNTSWPHNSHFFSLDFLDAKSSRKLLGAYGRVMPIVTANNSLRKKKYNT